MFDKDDGVTAEFSPDVLTQFQFVQKSAKYKDGWTEVQLDPPTGSRNFRI